jgi:hypothetical protein
MARGGWRIASGLLVLPAVVAGAAGCSNGSAATSSASAATAASTGGTSAAMLQKALLTRVNGVAAAAPASSGKYLSATGTGGKLPAGVSVTPTACTTAATVGIAPTVLAGSPAAAETFRVGTNEVSEVLIASTAKSASSALAGQVPAACARYEETVKGKTATYQATEQAVTGIGTQAKLLNLHPVGAASDDVWSVIYTGTGFVGTVTVVGPNASKAAVQQLGKQAYGYATKSLS